MANTSLTFVVFCLCTIACHATECPIECETSQTCCPSPVAGDYLCCPHPNAVCCADGENCCPKNTLCDASRGGCVLQLTSSQEFHDRKGPQDLMDTPSQEFRERKGPQDLMDDTEPTVEPEEKSYSHPKEFYDRKGLQNLMDDTQPAVEPVEEKSNIVFCPDFLYCPEHSTCCIQPDSTFGCCPYVNAVCCDDLLHCCPSGEHCDETYQYCIGKHQHASEMKWPAMPLE